MVHTIGHIIGLNAKPENSAEAQLLALMTTYQLRGLGRATQEMMSGFSLTFSILPITLGGIVSSGCPVE